MHELLLVCTPFSEDAAEMVVGTLRPVYTRGDTRASSDSPLVWAKAMCTSHGHPGIERGSDSSPPHLMQQRRLTQWSRGQLSVLRWGWVCTVQYAPASFSHYKYQWLDNMLSPELTFTNIHSRWHPDGNWIMRRKCLCKINEVNSCGRHALLKRLTPASPPMSLPLV